MPGALPRRYRDEVCLRSVGAFTAEDAEGTGNVGEWKNRCGRQGIFGLAYKRDSSLRSE